MYADMIFKFGYVHCDPHPGNVLVKKDPVTGCPQIVLLDHGLYTVSFSWLCHLIYQFKIVGTLQLCSLFDQLLYRVTRVVLD